MALIILVLLAAFGLTVIFYILYKQSRRKWMLHASFLCGCIYVLALVWSVIWMFSHMH